jgi:hypothetical protein
MIAESPLRVIHGDLKYNINVHNSALLYFTDHAAFKTTLKL